MKFYAIQLLLMFMSMAAFSQGDIEYSLLVVAPDGTPLPNIKVRAMETSTLKYLDGKTDAQGTVKLPLKGGKEWSISVAEIEKCLFALSVQGNIMVMKHSYVYDPIAYKRKQRQDPTRSNKKFKVIQQQVKEDAAFPQGTCFLTTKLQQPDGKIVSGITVEAVNVRDSLVYQAVTDEKGIARFILPNKSNYDIDIDNLKNYSFIDFGDDYIYQNLSLTFVPTIVKEKIVNDTVYQELDDQAKASSGRALMHFNITGGKRNGIKERMYLRELSSGKVYSAVSNDKGYALFLVPTKQIYMIDFNYQKNVDAVNLKYSSELTFGRMNIRYSPDPRLEYPETFIPTPDRLILKNVSEFLYKQFERPKDRPFNLVIKSIRRIHRQSQEALFMLTLAGSESYGNVRLPMNAALVLDKSGSMYCNDRSNALKQSLLEIANTLSDQDIISVILFDDQAVEVQHSTRQHKQGLQLVADNYSPRGGTNILGGMEQGAQSINRSFDKNKSNKIILLTDGYGDNPPKDITDFVEAKFSQGIEFSAIGLGDGCNQSLLQLIAMKGNGTFSYVDNSSALSNTFLKEMKGSLSYMAKDLKVNIYHNKKMIFSNLYGYPVKNKTDNQVSFEIGKVPSGRNDIAFLKFKLNNPSQEIEKMPLRVEVSYFDLYTKQTVTYSQEVALTWTNETDTELLIDQEEKKLYAIAIMNQSLKLMAEAYEKMDVPQAKSVLKQGKEQIDEIFPEAKPSEVKELFDDVGKYLELLIQIEKNGFTSK